MSKEIEGRTSSASQIKGADMVNEHSVIPGFHKQTSMGFTASLPSFRVIKRGKSKRSMHSTLFSLGPEANSQHHVMKMGKPSGKSLHSKASLATGRFTSDSPTKINLYENDSSEMELMYEEHFRWMERGEEFMPAQIIVIPADYTTRHKIRTERGFNDSRDVSRHPSYTNLKIPYNTICQSRYNQAKRKYMNQFFRELKMLETREISAVEATRFHRIFCISTLWPPLHTTREIDYVFRELFKLPPKQQTRLDFLLREIQR